MPSVASGTVSNNISGNLLTFTDTGSYTAPVSSRVLQINDYNGNPLQTINMGSSLTATYPITADQYITFILSVTDANGVVPPFTLNVDATGFYDLAYNNIIKVVGCSCSCSVETFMNLIIGEIYLASAIRYGVAANGVASQNALTLANQYINS